MDEVAKKVSSGNATAMALTEAFESAEEDRRKAEQVRTIALKKPA